MKPEHSFSSFMTPFPITWKGEPFYKTGDNIVYLHRQYYANKKKKWSEQGKLMTWKSGIQLDEFKE